MKKPHISSTYQFWLLPLNQFIQDNDHPYSETSSNALSWAKHLLWCNERATGVKYHLKGMNKDIILERGNLPSFRKQESLRQKD